MTGAEPAEPAEPRESPPLAHAIAALDDEDKRVLAAAVKGTLRKSQRRRLRELAELLAGKV